MDNLPIITQHPDYQHPNCVSICKNIRSRCSRVIDGTENHKISYGCSTLQWMIRKLDAKRIKPGPLYASEKDPENDGFTTASLLYNNIDAFNLNDNNNLSWSQYFSLLALTLIQQAHYFKHVLNGRTDSDDHAILSCAMSYHVAEAMEAITIAEMLFNNPRLHCYAEGLSSKRVYSLKNARQPIHKLQIVNDLQSDLIRFWSKGKFNSRTDAARRYHDFVSGEGNTMDRDKVIRKFTKTIGEYEKTINNIIKQTHQDNH